MGLYQQYNLYLYIFFFYYYNFLHQYYEDLSKKNFKDFLRLSPCKHSLIQPINISYIDFWPTFRYKRFYFQRLLENNYKINVIRNIPDNNSVYLFYSMFGSKHYNIEYKKCVKIYYIGENAAPKFIDTDYCIGFYHIKSERYIRFPLYLIEIQ